MEILKLKGSDTIMELEIAVITQLTSSSRSDSRVQREVHVRAEKTKKRGREGGTGYTRSLLPTKMLLVSTSFVSLAS